MSGKSALADSNMRKFYYDPNKVFLKGIVKVGHEYGPPGYGENPSIDEKIVIYKLKIPYKITIIGDPKDEVNSETVRDIQEIQMISLKSNMHLFFEKSVGRCVSVKGMLERAVIGHDYTPVILKVETISYAE